MTPYGFIGYSFAVTKRLHFAGELVAKMGFLVTAPES
jgi:hypothetical protein